MSKAPVYIYLWLAYHVIFIAAFILRRVNPLNIATGPADNLVYNPVYYYVRKVFLTLFYFLATYLVFIKWIAGWHIDSWYLEAAIVFFMFCSGHLVFIVSKTDTYTTKFAKFRGPYIALSAAYILLFYVRCMLGVLAGLSYNVHNIAYFFPDIRYNELYLFQDYYLSYSETKGIVVVEKYFLFSKDVVKNRQLNNAICSFSESSFTDDMEHPEQNPFAFAKRHTNDVILFTNNSSGMGKGYIDFHLDPDGSLKISGYRYTYPDNDFKKALQYVPCGTYTLKK